MDLQTAQVLISAFAVVNTALLVYQAVRLQQVHTSVNGAKDAAVEAAHTAGILVGLNASDTAAPTTGSIPSPIQPNM